jgi:hypothetical protein
VPPAFADAVATETVVTVSAALLHP